MEDRELLELAAKAAGMYVKGGYVNPDDTFIGLRVKPSKGDPRYLTSAWNPLTDDGDALRLAVKLRLNLNFEEWDGAEFACAVPNMSYQGYDEVMDDDPYAATRRAITRVAAEIGRNME